MMTLEKFAEAVSSEVAKRLGAGFHAVSYTHLTLPTKA